MRHCIPKYFIARFKQSGHLLDSSADGCGGGVGGGDGAGVGRGDGGCGGGVGVGGGDGAAGVGGGDGAGVGRGDDADDDLRFLAASALSPGAALLLLLDVSFARWRFFPSPSSSCEARAFLRGGVWLLLQFFFSLRGVWLLLADGPSCLALLHVCFVFSFGWRHCLWRERVG